MLIPLTTEKEGKKTVICKYQTNKDLSTHEFDVSEDRNRNVYVIMNVHILHKIYHSSSLLSNLLTKLIRKMQF